MIAGDTKGAAALKLTRPAPPPDGQAYFGFTFRLWDTSDPVWGDIRSFAERIQDSIEIELTGKTPAFLTVWATWQFPDQAGKPMVPFSNWAGDVRKVQNVTGPNSLLFLDWTLTAATSQNGGITVKDVAAGGLDNYIRSYATAIKAYGKPVLIRLFGGEFNGSWWWAQSPLANPTLVHSDFVSAWQRVALIFRQAGAKNAAWVWTPNVYPPTPVPWVDSNIAAYYPGDQYVDWAGGDIYDYAPITDLDPLYEFAVSHRKPFFLAEWGVRHEASGLTPIDQRAWLEAMFNYVETHPQIKSISYFNYNSQPSLGVPRDPARIVQLYDGKVTYQANINDHDHRLLADSGAGFRVTFARRISSSRYVSTAISSPAVVVNGDFETGAEQYQVGTGAWQEVQK